MEARCEVVQLMDFATFWRANARRMAKHFDDARSIVKRSIVEKLVWEATIILFMPTRLVRLDIIRTFRLEATFRALVPKYSFVVIVCAVPLHAAFPLRLEIAFGARKSNYAFIVHVCAWSHCREGVRHLCPQELGHGSFAG